MLLLLAALLSGSAPAPDVRTPDVLATIAAVVGGIESGARYAIAYADVGGDLRDEALVYLVDRNRCGSGGCSLLILTPSGKGWRKVGQTSVTQLPVYRLLSRRGGWNDLTVGVGGGGHTSGIAVLRFAQGRYPPNPTVQPKLNRIPYGARLLISDSGVSLQPVVH